MVAWRGFPRAPDTIRGFVVFRPWLARLGEKKKKAPRSARGLLVFTSVLQRAQDRFGSEDERQAEAELVAVTDGVVGLDLAPLRLPLQVVAVDVVVDAERVRGRAVVVVVVFV